MKMARMVGARSSRTAKPEPTPEQIRRAALKAEAARRLGLLDKVAEVGWGGLTAAESGRVGGFITKWERSGGPESDPDPSPPS
jgi:hypothetical protein